MGTAAAPLPFARLAGVGLVVFLANAALLILQLVASRLLAPFIGSDLYTWTAIIGVFLTGIALGNAYGGKLADRYPHPRTLAALLAAGAVAALWMALMPMLLNATGLHRSIPLGPRIPILAAALCLPAGFILSLLTPVAIKLGLPDVSKTGRVAGMVFALSTLGCLLGNYLTGFYLIPAFTINMLVYVSAGLLALLAGGSLLLRVDPSEPGAIATGASTTPIADAPGADGPNTYAFADIRQAYLIVFLSSFGGMTLELTASRILAPELGVSLYTWTGIIGVMLAGTALGNLTGGLVADRVNRPGSTYNPRDALAGTLIGGAVVTVGVLVALSIVTNRQPFEKLSLIEQVIGFTFSLFFLPMFILGMVSPQVIRLAVPDVAHVGRVAGRVYAWSTAGAIVGTFAAGYVLISTIGANRVVLLVALVLCYAGARATPIWKKNLMLYGFAIAMGGIVGGFILQWRPLGKDEDATTTIETSYYRIRVTEQHYLGRVYLNLNLDHLLHSTVDPNDPLFIHYEHEYVQIEFLRAARERDEHTKTLVIGGGGYTFPRYAMEVFPETQMDVVEIDPGVTRAAKQYLKLKDYRNLHHHNMDGRQFVAERTAPGSYDLVVQDAVNDLSVPWHLLTREYNDAVKKSLKPDGVYLLTVIDSVEHGRLWRSAMRTLRQTFTHVELLTFVPMPDPVTEPDNWNYRMVVRQVYVIYASDRPLDLKAMREAIIDKQYPDRAAWRAIIGAPFMVHDGNIRTHEVPEAALRPFLMRDPGVLLTDQYAPVDNLMAEIFRRQKEQD